MAIYYLCDATCLRYDVSSDTRNRRDKCKDVVALFVLRLPCDSIRPVRISFEAAFSFFYAICYNRKRTSKTIRLAICVEILTSTVIETSQRRQWTIDIVLYFFFFFLIPVLAFERCRVADEVLFRAATWTLTLRGAVIKEWDLIKNKVFYS